MVTPEDIQQLRELVALQAAQLEAVAQELNAQRTATAQTEVRAGLSLVDTKPNVYSGEHDGECGRNANACDHNDNRALT